MARLRVCEWCFMMGQADIIRVMRAFGVPVTAKTICLETGLGVTSMYRCLGRLVRGGFVERSYQGGRAYYGLAGQDRSNSELGEEC